MKIRRPNQMWAAGILLALLLPVLGHAQQVNVSAALSRTQAGVGEPLQLQIEVEGASRAKVPDNFAVDGLDIFPTGQSTKFNMINFQVSMSVVYTFQVVPQREGIFTIPPLAVEVGNEIFRTQPLEIQVRGAASIPAPQAQPAPGIPGPFRPQPAQPAPPPMPPDQQGVPIDQIAFIELIVPETEVFVGQVVPVEIRLFLDRRFRFELGQMPVFSGEGFTAEKLSEPVERSQVRDGVPYQVISFYSAITAVKAGPIEISPARIACQVVIPSSGRSGSIFDDFFGGNPFGSLFGETRRLELASDSVTLTARPLPRDGRPADFTGAIGQFSIEQNVDPSKSKVGDPVKLAIVIAGQGNFPAITGPTLDAADDWRVYPGGEQFTPADSIGFGGRKSFEFTLMPMRETRATPPATFSYFDPVEEKYVTLNAGSEPVLVQGGTAPADPVPTPARVATTPAQPEPAAGEEEIQQPPRPALADLQPAPGWRPGSFVAMPARPEFLIANGAALLAFLCAATGLVVVARQRSSGGRLARLRKDQLRLLQRMENPRLEAGQFFEAAAEYLRLQQRIHARDPELVADEHLLTSEPLLTPDLRGKIKEMLALRDELKFATAARPPTDIQRQETIDALKMLAKQLA